MKVEIKNGIYGRYVEFYTEDNVRKTFSLGKTKGNYSLVDITKMIRGETINFTGRDTTNYAVVSGEASLMTSKRDGRTYLRVSEKKVKKTLDTAIIADAIKNATIDTTSTESIIKSCADVISTLTLVGDWEVYHTYDFRVSDTSVVEVIRAGIKRTNFFWHNTKTPTVDLMHILIENEQMTSVVTDNFDELKTQGEQYREECIKKAAEERKRKEEEEERARIQAIIDTPWIEETLSTIHPDEASKNYVAEFLKENYPNDDPNTVVLYRHKSYNYSEHNIHSIYGHSTSSHYVSNVLPGLDLRKAASSDFFLTSTFVNEISVDFDPSITHKITYTTYND